MQQLNNMVDVLKILEAPNGLCEKVTSLSTELKSKLIDAISAMHPEQVFTVDEAKSRHCAGFLREYIDNGGHIFSLTMTCYFIGCSCVRVENFVDGFGLRSRECRRPVFTHLKKM